MIQERQCDYQLPELEDNISYTDSHSPPQMVFIEQPLANQIAAAERLSQNSYLEYIFNSKNGLRTRYRRKMKLLKIQKTKQSCQVCQLPYQKNDIVQQLPCQHMIHKECSRPWFEVSAVCPICRFDINKFYRQLESEKKI